ncbi:MAG: hypothetical protein J1F63_10210 [Oscillospiraceae bacterium]|nr:hypothetical protein [Oscillospiraceae bacterium]
MHKKLLALLLAMVMILACVPVTVGAVPIISVGFSKDELTAGLLSASFNIAETGASGPRRFFAAIVYCDKDGQLIDFAASPVETASRLGGIIYDATASLTLSITEDVSAGQYAKAVLLDGETLAPISISLDPIYCAGPEPEPTYTGIFERYYTIDSENGCIAMNGSTVTVAETGTPFRLKDMGDGYVGFVDSSAPKRRLSTDDGSVIRRLYGFGGSSMLWKLEPTENGKYYISHYDGGYMAIENGTAVVSETPCAFELNFAGESDFTRMTGLDGFKLLSEAEQQSVIDICTSVGAGIFPSGTNSDTMLEIMEAAFAGICSSRNDKTPEQQRDAILAAVRTPPKYNAGETDEMQGVLIDSLPEGGAEISQTAPVKEHVDYIWDLGEGVYNRIDATYTGFGHSQTVKFYYNESGATNVQTAIGALARFPYEYRQFITQVNVYVPTTSFTYNCDGPVLTVRVPDGTNVETMARNFAHELGHSIDYCGGGVPKWDGTAEWQAAIENDLATVSIYGNSNSDEGFAEFARLYFQSYGSRDRMIGVKQLYPNRYASFVKLLNKIGMETLY